MGMGVEQSRDDGPALEVDKPGRGRCLFQQSCVIAYRGDLTRSYSNSLRDARSAIEGDDPATVQDQIRRKHALFPSCNQVARPKGLERNCDGSGL
jgi:hypothetical protein